MPKPIRDVILGFVLAIGLAEALTFAVTRVRPNTSMPSMSDRVLFVAVPLLVGIALVALARWRFATSTMLSVAACLLLLVLTVPALTGYAPSGMPGRLLRYFFALSAEAGTHLLVGLLLALAWTKRRATGMVAREPTRRPESVLGE